MKKKKIIVVCRGNIARSPIAGELIKKEFSARGVEDKYEVISRGVQGTRVDPEPVKHTNIVHYPSIFRDIEPILKKYEIDLCQHVSTPIKRSDMMGADLVLAVDKKTKKALGNLFPKFRKKVVLVSQLSGKKESIADPEKANGLENQEKIFLEIYNNIHEGFSRLIGLVENSE